MNDDHYGRATGRPDPASTRSTQTTVRILDRVLDGTRVWGSIEAGPPRHGVRRYRLVLFPPGVTLAERRLLRLWRAMPTWVGVLWLMSLICLTQVFTPWVALATATAVYLGIGLVTFDRLGAARTRVRTMSVVLIAGYSDPEAAATYAELKRITITLFAADALLDEGRISVAEHESIWWHAYEWVGTRSDTADNGRV